MSENKFEDFNEGDRIEVVQYTAGDVERLNIMGMRGTVIPGTFGSTFLGLVAMVPDVMPDEFPKAYFLFLPEEIEKLTEKQRKGTVRVWTLRILQPV